MSPSTFPEIQNPAVSWCKVEAFVTNPNHISVSKCGDAPPPVIIMTLNMKTVPNPKTHQNEVSEQKLSKCQYQTLQPWNIYTLEGHLNYNV